MYRRSECLTALTLICLLISLVLGGCSRPIQKSTNEASWPELEPQTEKCIAISGRYSATPRIHGKADKPVTPLLAYTLLPFSEPLTRADRIDLTVAETDISITAYAAEVLLQSHTYSAKSGAFECIAGNLEFHPQKKPGAAQATAQPGLAWHTVRLRRTVDGSLLLQEADGLAGLAFMLFPIYLTNEHWYLFKQVE